MLARRYGFLPDERFTFCRCKVHVFVRHRFSFNDNSIFLWGISSCVGVFAFVNSCFWSSCASALCYARARLFLCFSDGLRTRPSRQIFTFIYLLAWGLLATWLLAEGLVRLPAAADGPQFAVLIEWLLWPGVSLMVCATLTSLGVRLLRPRAALRLT